ncbi:homeobox protein HMX3-like isoform X2 [Chiroxiphia lanceolata]|uniref:homeobox protein HMX3-like isoform X2 n=1 Tax=Chiroxiphia lanceolata TaxID=296741 RepID=UPI0013CE7534|nr:homeobox protein HMX3-like isoform X2 [Chiroxiphia lanceolata]
MVLMVLVMKVMVLEVLEVPVAKAVLVISGALSPWPPSSSRSPRSLRQIPPCQRQEGLCPRPPRIPDVPSTFGENPNVPPPPPALPRERGVSVSAGIPGFRRFPTPRIVGTFNPRLHRIPWERRPPGRRRREEASRGFARLGFARLGFAKMGFTRMGFTVGFCWALPNWALPSRALPSHRLSGEAESSPWRGWKIPVGFPGFWELNPPGGAEARDRDRDRDRGGFEAKKEPQEQPQKTPKPPRGVKGEDPNPTPNPPRGEGAAPGGSRRVGGSAGGAAGTDSGGDSRWIWEHEDQKPPEEPISTHPFPSSRGVLEPGSGAPGGAAAASPPPGLINELG